MFWFYFRCVVSLLIYVEVVAEAYDVRENDRERYTEDFLRIVLTLAAVIVLINYYFPTQSSQGLILIVAACSDWLP